ncbi:MAG: PQQ-binding-like beta-propeller repeat protein [Rubripirellula sp.]|nr:PQQ-binding-like beta-propeller repeat protein [Rubripirellula sp.]
METIESVLPDRARKSRRRAIVGLAVGVSSIAVLQVLAPSTDHQMANMASFLIGLITLCFVGLQLHRLAKLNGHRLQVPVTVMSTIAIACLVFEFDGFSGELLPQFKLRFGGSVPPLRVLSSQGESRVDTEASGKPSTDSSGEVASTGFLGNQRTGVISKREFAVPTDVSELEIVWDQGIGAGWASFAVGSGRAVTLEQRESMDCVTCYDLQSGELLWMQSHQAVHSHPMGGAGPRSTPTIDGDKVYAQDAEGLVWCLDLRSGKTVWVVDLLELAGWTQVESEAAVTWGRSGSPLLVDGLCVLPYGGPAGNQATGRSLIALDAESGEVRWTAGTDQISYASPVLMNLGGQKQIVSVNEKTVSGHLVDDGKLLWEISWPGQSSGGANCASAVDAGDDRLIVGKGYGGGSALVKVTRDQEGNFAAVPEWESMRFLKTKFTHACVDANTAYGISNGSLEAIKIDSCERLWTQSRRSRFGQGQILLVEDVIVGQAEAGEVVFARATPDDYEELSRFSALQSKTWNIPTIAGRYLLVRNDRQAICYRLPPRESE